MPFYEQLFPPRISASMEGGPRFLASQAFAQSGQRVFNLYDPNPIREYRLSHPLRNQADFEELRAFFHAVRGVDPFLFRDPSDYIATTANTSLTLISGSDWQMNRIYVAPTRTSIRPIYKPAAGARIIRTRGGTPSDVTAGSTINTTNGRVSITGHVVGDTYTWTGTFNVPVYFTEPEALFRVLGGGQQMLTEWTDINLRESREIA
jgi:uncharacterized protein (TIGR02217 family)